jgi:hypothetical protein
MQNHAVPHPQHWKKYEILKLKIDRSCPRSRGGGGDNNILNGKPYGVFYLKTAFLYGGQRYITSNHELSPLCFNENTKENLSSLQSSLLLIYF